MMDKYTKLVVGVGMLIIVGIHLNGLLSAFWSNIAWLHLVKANTFAISSETWATEALNHFQKAVNLNDSNHRAFLGMGMIHVRRGDEVAALSHWRRAVVDPQILIGLGDSRKINRQWNEALLYYKGAINVADNRLSEAYILAGEICQATFAEPEHLMLANQVFCQDYFFQNEDNLLVNGYFTCGDAEGWSKRFFSGFSGEYQVDEVVGKFPPAQKIIGVADNEVGGLFQAITLPPGIQVRYSAWVKVVGGGDMQVRLLHIVWHQEDGSPRGNQLQTISSDTDWTYWERTFQVPEARGSKFTFSPALLTGKGTVWIDDVRLEILPEK